jgi:hypothetical protein
MMAYGKFLMFALLLACLPARAGATEWTFNQIPPYKATAPQGWTQQSSKVVYDGDHFYTTTWPRNGQASVVRLKNGELFQYCNPNGIVQAPYQPGSIVIDQTGRLITVTAQAFDPPTIKMSTQPPKNFANFADVQWATLPTLSMRATYVSAATYNNGPNANYLIIVYWNPDDDTTYIARLDLNNLPAGWATNALHVNDVEETWLYAGIHIINMTNINISFASAPKDGTSHYTKAIYVRTDWKGHIAAKEYIATGFNAYITDMVRGPSGKYHFAMRYEAANSQPYSVRVVTRMGPNNYRFVELAQSPYALELTHTILFVRGTHLYAISAHAQDLKLYRSTDYGTSFTLTSTELGYPSMGYVSGVKQSSGGVYPSSPVFTLTSGVAGGVAGRYTQWVITADWPEIQ